MHQSRRSPRRTKGIAPQRFGIMPIINEEPSIDGANGSGSPSNNIPLTTSSEPVLSTTQTPIAGQASQMQQIVEANKRLILLKQQVAEQEKARAALEQARIGYEQELAKYRKLTTELGSSRQCDTVPTRSSFCTLPSSTTSFTGTSTTLTSSILAPVSSINEQVQHYGPPTSLSSGYFNQSQPLNNPQPSYIDRPSVSTPIMQLPAPAAHFSAPAAHFSAPAAYFSAPAAHFSAPAAHLSAPAAHFSAPAAHFSDPAAQFSVPTPANVSSSHPTQQYVVVMQRNNAGEDIPHVLPVYPSPDPIPSHPQTWTPSSGGPMINSATQFPIVHRQLEQRRLHDLPIFSGKPEDWPVFESTFQTTTTAFGYSDLENLLRLQKALCGDARTMVQSMLIFPEHVAHVVATLKGAFGRPELLVNSQIQLARSIQPIDESKLDQLVPFSISVNNLAMFLDGEATQHHLNNPTLLDELVGKLPISRRIDWAGVACQIKPIPTIKHFASWLSELSRLVNLVTSQPDKQTPSSSRSNTVLLSVENEVKSNVVKVCQFCAEAHDINSCEEFLRLSVEERWHEVTKRPLCYGCLDPDHLLPGCTKRQKCLVNGCTKWHNRLLHPTRVSKESSSAIGTFAASSTQSTSKKHKRRFRYSTSKTVGDKHPPTNLNCHEKQTDGILLFRVVPVVLHGANHRSLETFALLDEGSSISMIEEGVANQLGLEGATSELNIQWFGSHSSSERSRKVSLGISGCHENDLCFRLDNIRTIQHLTLPIQSLNRRALLAENPHLSEIPFQTFENAHPTILLGLDHHHLGVPHQIKMSSNQDGIVAAETKLGWVIYGSSGRKKLPGAVVLHINEEKDETLSQLHELVRQHFTTEEFGVKVAISPIESDEILRARALLKATTKRVGDRFETGLLWKRDDTVLPDSYGMALRRLHSIEAKMRRNIDYGEQYRMQITSYVSKGYARKMSDVEANRRSNRTWFLPHFAVQSKPGKFRIVFDAAAKVGNVSLNSSLLAGPDMNVPLARLLYQFRIGKVGVCADIREMFHQVLVRKPDQDSQRFLWRDGNSSLEPEVYVMQVMIFGSTCSPASAQHVKNMNASECALEFPVAADLIKRRHYVDDYVASYDTPEEAIKYTANVIEIHQRGGFELRGVLSNCQEVRSQFGDASKPTVRLEPDPATQKILGMTWDTTEDVFRFETSFGKVRREILDGKRVPSKRDILSVAMSIFDPFGILANFVLISKVILQDLWRLEISWDEPIPEDINSRWQAWRSQIERTFSVKVPRCYGIKKTTDLELHVFADASEVAFAAVAYWKVRNGEDTQLSFVAGKARCAPVKILTIPRLELQAAVLATRLLREIYESHEDVSIARTVLWTDSETVLKWIRSDQRRYNVFVAFRVAEIVEIAPAPLWHWVPTHMNVADDATRVSHPPYFDPESRWLRGPAWLLQPEEHWPVQPPTSTTSIETAEEETRRKFVGIISHKKGLVNFQRFSKFFRLCRTMAWVHRFLANTQAPTPDDRTSTELRSSEVSNAIATVCRLVQQESYPKEIASLQSRGQVFRDSKIFTLKPYLDEFGLIRLHGRTDAASEEHMAQETKRPIVLPHEHHVSMLIVRHYHERNAHQLTDATIAAVRTKYWIPGLRSLVRSVKLGCQLCRYKNATPFVPIQGQLPLDRMEAYSRPFTNTGLDFFGPVAVTVGRRQEKRWVALFTCLTTRAVHLEIAADLSTDACLLCIRNLCNIRGVPSIIRCDNGTNFVGARNELTKEDTFFDPQAIQQDLTTHGVEWKFNCPGNPEAGGAWERLVQSVKRVLRVTLHEQAPRVETLRALLMEAANIVNSRPLTHLQVDPHDLEPLTPNHFLMGGSNTSTIPNPNESEPRATRKQWRISRSLSRCFWKQWVRDYLPELTRRSKHYSEQAPLKVDDLVIVCDGNQPRSQWSRGRIIAVATGPDGHVRTATLRTKDGEMRRPVTKLAKIDVGPSVILSSDGARDVANFP